MAVNPPRRPGRELTGPTGSGRPATGSFSLKPVGGPVARIERGEAPAQVAAPSLPRRVLERLKTAISDVEIEAQINRMLRLITLGIIDRSAARGSYLNLLV